MRAPSTEQLEAIQHLASRPEGRLFVEYLQAAHAETRARLEQTDEAHAVRALQGEARMISYLLQRWSTPTTQASDSRP